MRFGKRPLRPRFRIRLPSYADPLGVVVRAGVDVFGGPSRGILLYGHVARNHGRKMQLS